MGGGGGRDLFVGGGARRSLHDGSSGWLLVGSSGRLGLGYTATVLRVRKGQGVLVIIILILLIVLLLLQPPGYCS